MNKVKNKAQDFLDRLKKQAREESEEFAKHTSAQITGEDTHSHDDTQTSPVVEAMGSDEVDLTDEQKIAIQRKHIQKLKQMEDELEKYRKLRKKLDQQRSEDFDKSIGKISEPGAPIEKTLSIPKSKPSRKMGAGQKGASVETRKSKQ